MMAKANAVSGSTVYVAEGQDVPADVPDGVRLVGPGAPGPVNPEPDAGSEPDVEIEPPARVADALAGDGPATGEPPRRPAHADPKADWVAWAVAGGLRQEDAEGMTKAELQDLP